MKKYEVTTEFSGYVRGVRTYGVEAESPEEAQKLVEDGDVEHHDECIIRDDCERGDVLGVIEVTEHDNQ